MKTYVLTVSERFPQTHPRAGEQTNFPLAIKSCDKIHTIRGNYELWAKRFEQIDAGKALLSVRIWEGRPYNSKQREIFSFEKSAGIGIQKIDFSYDYQHNVLIDGKVFSDVSQISKNDGLTDRDFENWFAGYDLTKPMAIIHFTDFRYI